MSDSDDSFEVETVVIDNGSGRIKAGFAGDDAPRACFLTVVGRPHNKDVTHRDALVGDEAQHKRDVLSLSCPITRGVVENWDDMEIIWRHIFQHELRVDPKTRPILITEPPLNPKQNREKIAEIMFEAFDVPALHVELDSVLDMYAQGSIYGVIVSCGESVSSVYPIYEGSFLKESVKRIDFGGKDITDKVHQYISERGYQTLTKTSLDRTIAQTIKELLCYVSENYEDESTRVALNDYGHRKYKLPDGLEISLAAERYHCSESIFKPELIGHDHVGLHRLVFDSIMSTHPDVRGTLFKSIILSGGSTMYPGIKERMQTEIKDLIDTVDHVLSMPVRVCGAPERKCTVWIGGSILATLSSSESLFLTKSEYNENGATAIHSKGMGSFC